MPARIISARRIRNCSAIARHNLRRRRGLGDQLRSYKDLPKETGKSVSQIALNWLLQRPTVSTLIIGARNETQLRENLGAVGWSLTKDQIAKLDAASKVTLPYPDWHQRTTFTDRNPPAV
ncbi:aryl-alcohol dehydrogenase-like predicted oxidoreductase [Bradyrhizobium betae]|nr:aldo/keto reductase [Bradyrhizobium betae]MCS3730792.1 aryl-alcohol dehydrogenase-like predicted oxidoreductase [Bradyrhizobium betae]